MLSLQIFMDYVIIEAGRINRPSHISRSDWMRKWEHIARKGVFL